MHGFVLGSDRQRAYHLAIAENAVIAITSGIDAERSVIIGYDRCCNSYGGAPTSLELS
jgi:hypothetical protein